MSPTTTITGTLEVARIGADPATFRLRASVPLTGTLALTALRSNESPTAGTVWVTATWDAPATTEVEGTTTWYERAATMLLAGDQAPPRADQITRTPGEWACWGLLSDPPAVYVIPFDVYTVLG